MVAAKDHEDLAIKRARLDAEVAVLRRELGRFNARLDSLRRSGSEPRGFVTGVLAGLVVALVGFTFFWFLAGSVIGSIGG